MQELCVYVVISFGIVIMAFLSCAMLFFIADKVLSWTKVIDKLLDYLARKEMFEEYMANRKEFLKYREAKR